MWTVSVLLIQLLIILILPIYTSGQSQNPTTVVVTTPVAEVEEGQILSIHCKITNIKEGQEVSILKLAKDSKISAPVKLSANEQVPEGTDSRVFIARRPLSDGSNVYFLSIIEVKLSDNGIYFCKVTEYTKDASTRDVATGQVNVDILHFPEPACSSNVKDQVSEGDLLRFNCSTGPANPNVSIEWKVAGSGRLPRSASISQTRSNRYTNSVMEFRASAKYNGVVFICSTTSKPFPGKFKTCHVGAVNVESSGFPTYTEEIETIGNTLLEDFLIPPVHSPDTSDTDIVTDEIDCKKHCKWFSTNVMYWVIATITISIIAFIFFIFGLVLIIKYCRLTDSPHSESLSIHPNQMEQIYSELELKRGDVKQYMALMKPVTNTADIMSPKDRDRGRFDENPAQ